MGIPTGAPKTYATYYMIAALANLDYGNLNIHWAVTGLHEEAKYAVFRRRLTELVGAVDWQQGVCNSIHYVALTLEQRNTNYGPILQNKAALRDAFLDSDAEYFLLLGGDNPPPRHAVRHLLKVDADISMGTCYQRPGQDSVCGVYPLVWRFMWLPKDIDKLRVEPENIEELRKAWLNCPSLMNVCYDPKWKKRKVIWNVAGGDGCALIKRKVLERIDWSVSPTGAYNSEDIFFMSQAVASGFTTACATDLHIPHLHESGLVF